MIFQVHSIDFSKGPGHRFQTQSALLSATRPPPATTEDQKPPSHTPRRPQPDPGLAGEQGALEEWRSI
jgi:hypothetical protein